MVPVWLVVRDCTIIRIVIDMAGILVAAAQRAANAYQLAQRAVQRLVKLLTGPDGQPIRGKNGQQVEVVVRRLLLLLLCWPHQEAEAAVPSASPISDACMQLAEEVSTFYDKEAAREVAKPGKDASSLQQAAQAEAAAERLEREGNLLTARAQRAKARQLRLEATLCKAGVIVAFRAAVAANAYAPST